MNKKLFALILSIVMIGVGCVISYFAKYELVQMSGFAVTMFGAGLAVNQLWNSRKEDANNLFVILGIILIGLGSFIAGIFMLMDIEQVKTFIGLIFAVVVFIVGLVTVFLNNKEDRKLLH